MTKIFKSAIVLSFILLFTANLIGNDDKIKWFNFNEGLEEAAKENKNIIVHIYADWCKWCRVMEKDTYGDPDVAKLVSEQFITIKFNGEATDSITYLDTTITQAELLQGFGIQGFPTTLFLKPNSEPITIVPGFQVSTTFINILEFINGNYYQNMTFEEFLEKKK